jgi:hypothetical protein
LACEIGPAGAAALAGSPVLGGLLSLDLSGNPLGTEGVRALADSPHLGRLRRLDLSHAKVGAEGLEALARSQHLTELRRLDLGHVGMEMIKTAFADPSRLPKLLELNYGLARGLSYLGRKVFA